MGRWVAEPGGRRKVWTRDENLELVGGWAEPCRRLKGHPSEQASGEKAKPQSQETEWVPSHAGVPRRSENE